MKTVISDAYNVIQSMKKLQNNVGFEFDVDQRNLAMAMRHLGEFYQELVYHAVECQKKEAIEKAAELKAALKKKSKSPEELKQDILEAEELRRYFLSLR